MGSGISTIAPKPQEEEEEEGQITTPSTIVNNRVKCFFQDLNNSEYNTIRGNTFVLISDLTELLNVNAGEINVKGKNNKTSKDIALATNNNNEILIQIYKDQTTSNTTPHDMSKTGDLKSLQQFAIKNPTYNWNTTNDFDCCPLYYACHSGAAININVVSFLLEVRDGGRLSVPEKTMDHCRINSISLKVRDILDGKTIKEENDINADGGEEDDFGVGGLFGGCDEDGDY